MMWIPLDRYAKIVEELDSLEREINNGKYDIPEDVRALSNKPEIIGGVRQIVSPRVMATAGIEIKCIGRIADIKAQLFHVPEIMHDILYRKLNGVKRTYHNRSLGVTA